MTISRLKSERGQAFWLTTIFMLFVGLGLSALVLDVGDWFRDKRRLQGTVDAAALAGAQQLPDDPSGAQAQALSYANKNGGDVAGSAITISSSSYGTNDTITVNGLRHDDGIFSKQFLPVGVDITAHGAARVGPPAEALHVAPMVVYCDHPLIQNCNNDHTPQFNVTTTMDYDPMGAPGAFGMLDLDGESGAIGSSTEAAWITHGFDKYLGLGKYKSDPGAKFGSNDVQSALDDRIGTILLFPVFKTLDGTGSNADYDIIGWIGFYLQSYDVHGNSATLHGYFTSYIAQGILSKHGPGSGGVPSSFFGVKSIQLIE